MYVYIYIYIIIYTHIYMYIDIYWYIHTHIRFNTSNKIIITKQINQGVSTNPKRIFEARLVILMVVALRDERNSVIQVLRR